jgi:hypothetical protein
MQGADPSRTYAASQQLQRMPSEREGLAAPLAQQQETMRAQQDLIRAIEKTNNTLEETNRLRQQGGSCELQLPQQQETIRL